MPSPDCPYSGGTTVEVITTGFLLVVRIIIVVVGLCSALLSSTLVKVKGRIVDRVKGRALAGGIVNIGAVELVSGGRSEELYDE